MGAEWTLADLPDQGGRVAVVTGANSGLGREIAVGLAGAGATVVLACRNGDRAAAAADAIRAAQPGAELAIAELDLADLASVADFAERFAAGHDRLDLLVNNAGLMAVDEARTADGFELQLGVNHLGHYALTNRLLPLLLATPGSRVATMSSFGHRPGRIRFDDLMFARGYRRWPAYFQSKLANLLFTAELQRRLAAAGAATLAVAAHPGWSSTDLGHEGRGISNLVTRLATPIAQPAVVGALPMLRAATDPGVRGGDFYGPRFMFAGRQVVRARPSARARDAAAARRLWAASAELTKTGPDLPAAR
jgi:protochlorophyllide reductase